MMTNKVKKFYTAPLLALTVVVFALSFIIAGSVSYAQKSTPIRVGIDTTEPGLHYLPLITAQEQGLFKRNGLDVIVKPYNSSQILIDDLIAGKIDFAFSHPLFPTVSREFDEPIKILGVITTGTAYYAYTKERRFEALDNLELLKDSKIAMYPDNHPLTYSWVDLMKKNQEIFNSVEVDPVEPKEHLSYITDDKVDLAFGVEPEISNTLELSSLRRSFAVDRFIGPAAHVVLSANVKRISRNLEVTNYFVHAIEDALITLSTDVIIGSQMANVAYPDANPRDLVEPVNRIISKGTYPSSLFLSKELWDNTLPMLLESGYLLEKIEYSDIVDNSYSRAQK